ncbi:Vacuolar protein sorting-associated protein 70 [Tilletia horrida]|uniref:Vacuolar protein sorting-associated protein 70 n=1 Tax=Tilletia horrida TaxID=155126 RepID=A0AAN6JSZ9_9BASI|nr:Vacuolar protein sorting-associated protein 70 [Tilletia horrida]KAK0565765.1 Vacuolar protein sorting-associated protein 70 [Tilletia horrida]
MTFPNTTGTSDALSKDAEGHQRMEDFGSYRDYHAHLLKVSDAIGSSNDPATQKSGAPLEIIEDRFLRVATAQSARAALKRYTAEPHPAGTKGSFNFALRILREWGSLLGAPVPDSDEEITATRVFQAGTAESRSEMTRGCSAGGQEEVRPRVWIDTYETLVTDPIRASLSLSRTGSKEAYWIADLDEAVVPEDSTSGHRVPPYHAFSGNGSVSGPLVYANQGSRADFRKLAELGVPVRGSIALVRYGRNFRGLKVSEAQRAGAVGVLIYSDPSEDGSVTPQNGYETYPNGPARHPTSIQRGSVRPPGRPGDPSTPGWPSYPGHSTKRVPLEETDLPRIPSLPISYANAATLFRALERHGPNATSAGKDWRGSIPGVGEYFVGPSEDVLHMENIVEHNLKPMYNVYACIPGHVSNETVFFGNHRDAWSFGAADPGSGTAVIHEIVKSLGALVNPPPSSSKPPFRPLRQVMAASWDGEEFGLAGSTEFGEDFSDFLQKHVAVYHNLDIAVQGGWLSLGAVPSLIDVFQRSAECLPDLRNKGNGSLPADQSDNEPLEKDRSLEIRRTSPLGSGSDYAVFLMHNGIAASMASYRRRRDDPAYMYHSNFDSFYWMENFGDPHFRRHESMAKLVGLVILRSASELALPIRVDHYATDLGRYLVQVERALGNARHTTTELVPLGELRSAVQRLKDATMVLERVRRKAAHAVQSHSPESQGSAAASEAQKPFVAPDTTAIERALQGLRTTNALVARFENGFLAQSPSSATSSPGINRSVLPDDFKEPPGLPFRPWFRHLIIAPGRQSGYGATPFPGLMEAITLDGDDEETTLGNTRPFRDDDLAKKETKRIVELLRALAAKMESALTDLGIDLQDEIKTMEKEDQAGMTTGYKARV